jgi:hypothetical protein
MELYTSAAPAWETNVMTYWLLKKRGYIDKVAHQKL